MVGARSHRTKMGITVAVRATLLGVMAGSCTAEDGGPPGGGAAAAVDVDAARDAGGGADAAADAGAEPLPPLVWAACDTDDWPDGYPRPPADTECTAIEVPLDDPAGPTLALRVARQPARSFSPRGAVFVLEGGPGGSSVFTSGLIPDAMPDLQSRFDLVYVDQRGTGGSGVLSCRGTPRTEADWVACAAQHQDTGLQHYLSVDVVRDLEVVRERLGYEQVHLFAVSYGTRVAFEYIRLHPDRIAAAVLDGLAPPPSDLFSDTVTAVDRGVEMLVRDCAADPDCLEVSPTLATDLEERRQALADTPRPIVVGGTPMVEGADDFAAFLGAFVHQSWWRNRIPRAIHEAVGGDSAAWDALLSEAMGAPVTAASGSGPRPLRPATRLPRGGLGDGFGVAFGSPVVKMAMLCAEILPNSPGVAALEELDTAQAWGDGSIVEKARACSSWPVEPIDAAQRQFVSSDVPILLLSGELDVNVDPRWASMALASLGDATHLLVPYATHLATYVPCVGQINSDFFGAAGDMSRVDTDCLERLRPPPW